MVRDYDLGDIGTSVLGWGGLNEGRRREETQGMKSGSEEHVCELVSTLAGLVGLRVCGWKRTRTRSRVGRAAGRSEMMWGIMMRISG